ncbi:hypothetical protein FACS1894109_03970 [Spirochaetia bacterium]|nr:hypothetical protein FACS1894109_03970 [Spirochaetia bacterium]
MPYFNTIREATSHWNLGVLNTTGTRHASGTTDKGIRVWLPIIDNSEEHWDNVLTEDKNMILQWAKADVSRKAYATGPLRIAATVITRKPMQQGNVVGGYIFDNVGNYCPIVFDTSQYLIIYAKENSFLTEGDIKWTTMGGALSWVSGFAADQQEARKKLNELTAKYKRS